MSAIPEELRAEVERWRNFPRQRPDRIERPGPGQESVWDYPRPPLVEPVQRNIRVEFGGVIIAGTERAYRVIETSSPPVYYIPQEDIHMEFLIPVQKTALCEWKGISQYWSVRAGRRHVNDAAWSYPDPWEGYALIQNHIAFNAGKMDACYVDDQRVLPQPGSYYGGWITPDIVGPFKGGSGSNLW